MKRNKTKVQGAVVLLLVGFVIVPALLLGGGDVGATIKEAIRLIATWGICALFYAIAGLLFRIAMADYGDEQIGKDLFTAFDVGIFMLMVVVIATAYAPSKSVWGAMMETIEFIAAIGIIIIFLVGFIVVAKLLYGDQVRASSRKNGR